MKHVQYIINFVSILVNWLLNLFPHADKVAHVILGFLITAIFMWIGAERWVSFGIGMTGGLVKESVWDRYKRGHISWLDWLSTILGSLLAAWFL